MRLAGFTTSGAELSDHGGAGAGMLTAASDRSSGTPVFEDKTVPGLLAKIVAKEPTPISSLREDVPPEVLRKDFNKISAAR